MNGSSVEGSYTYSWRVWLKGITASHSQGVGIRSFPLLHLVTSMFRFMIHDNVCLMEY